MTELPFSSICSFRAACRSNMASHVALKRLRSRESYSTCKDGKPGCDAWQVWQIHMETHGHVSAWQVLMRPSIALSAEFRSDLDAALLREIEDGDTRLEVGTDD